MNPPCHNEPPPYRAGEAVQFLITGQTPLGYTALIEGQYPGLLYGDTLSVPVAVGQTVRGFIRTVRPDGKIDLTLDQPGYRRIAPLAIRIIQLLQRSGGRLELDDDSPPETVREIFGASKKAFKQALGKLYKSRRIRFTHPGIELLDDTQWSPGAQAKVSPPGNHGTN